MSDKNIIDQMTDAIDGEFDGLRAEILRLRAELKESRRLFARETDEYIKWMDEAQAENNKLQEKLNRIAKMYESLEWDYKVAISNKGSTTK